MAADRAYRVQLSQSAQTDLDKICAHLAESHSPDLADEWLDAFLECVDSLERFPDRGSIPEELAVLGLRRHRQLLLRPYRLFYSVTEDRVTITLIADGRRDMGALLRARLLNP